MKTVAFVGMAVTSRADAPWDNPDIPIWVLNEMGHTDLVHPKAGDADPSPYKFIQRWDELFQIHARWDFTRNDNFNDPLHWEWLQEQDGTRPIWMQEQFEDIPGAQSYPLDEATALVAKVWIGDKQVQYFSATMPYMVAKAIVDGYERIELWGFEMSSGTEFNYQKPSSLFWLGVAAGRGLEIYTPPGCKLFQGPLYGYEGSTLIFKHDFVKRLAELEEIIPKLQDKLQATSDEAVRINVAHASIKPGNRAGLTQLKEEGGKVSQQQELFVAQINAIGGAIQENKYWIEFAENISDEDNQWVNRQHLEIRQRGIVSKQKESVGLLNKVNGQMLAVIQELKPKTLKKTERNRLTKKRNKLANERGKHNGITNALSGAVQENKRWILYVDQMLSGDTAGLGPESEEVVVQIVTPE